ncbi:MAG: hypothetical protein Q8M79_00920 [Dehalococcoidia bacterium]|nr:hypothetical protein [Dehalococcoidia bacterium]
MTSPHRAEAPYPLFLLAAMAFGTLGGFTLAVSLPIEAALGMLDLGWVSHAQMHGHLQVVGFAGLFVIGMALHLAPRFGSGSLAHPALVRPLLVLLVGGLLARALGQPLAEHPPFAALMAAGALAEAIGGLLFAVIIATTLGPALRARAPHAVLLAGGGVWFFVQAAIGAWWLSELALDGGIVLVSTRNAVLVNLQFFGFLLAAILGVGMRTFPTFFGMPPTPPRAAGGVAVLLHLGVGLWTAGGVAEVERVTLAGQATVGIAILAAVATFGFWRRTYRFAPASRGYIWALQPALAWLALTGASLLATALLALAEGRPVTVGTLDAVRHLFAVGVVTLLIVGMGQLILPEFASERLVAKPWHWRGAAFGAALTTAAVLRGILPWAGLATPARFWAMSVGGVIGLGTVAAFAFLYLRAQRRHRAYMAKIAALRSREIPLNTLE